MRKEFVFNLADTSFNRPVFPGLENLEFPFDILNILVFIYHQLRWKLF